MSTSAFRAGTPIVLHRKSYMLHRMISDDIWQLEDTNTRRIIEHTIQELHDFYVKGELKFGVPTERQGGRTPAPIATISLTHLENAKIRRLYAMSIFELPNSEILITAAVQDLWEKLQQPSKVPHWTTVYRWKRQLIDAGKDFTVLAEQRHTQGNRSRRYPEAVTDIVEGAIDSLYLKPEKGTLQDVLEAALAAVQAENALRPDVLKLPLPTRRLVKRMIDDIPAFDRYAARNGRTAAVKRFRAVLSHKTTAAPLERAEIDHTPLDMIVVDDETSLPLGRPYLTVCIDDYTRNVLGIYISFEPPSYFTVARCLKHAFQPKSDLRARYPSIENAWAAHGVMREVVVDNGREFHSESLENACFALGIEIHYSPRKTPWMKGKIERFQGTLNRAVAHGAPGTTFSNIFEKGDYDPAKSAVVRFSALKEIVHKWIADVYHQKVHRTLNAPPAAVWERSICPSDIQLLDDPGRLDFILGQTEKRILSHKGIELNNLFYNSREMTALRLKHGDRLELEVRVDRSDLGCIMVQSPDGRETFRVPCLNTEYATGLSAWQHEVIKKYARRHLNSYTTDGWLKAKAAIREIIETDFLHRKKIKTSSKIARFSNHDAKPATPAPATVLDERLASLPVATAPQPPLAKEIPLTPADLPSAPAPRTRKLKPVLTDRQSTWNQD